MLENGTKYFTISISNAKAPQCCWPGCVEQARCDREPGCVEQARCDRVPGYQEDV